MTALPAAVEHKPDVVLLDLGLPDVDGADVLSMLRSVSNVPVIVATARDDEADMWLLDPGADDYVIKPFTAAQIDARIRAVLRRMGETDEDPVITIGGLMIDTRGYEVTVDGRPVELARKEFELLLALARRAGEVVTKRDLLAEVWQLPWGGRTAPSTSTCRGCAASSVRRRPSRATCTVSAAWACDWRRHRQAVRQTTHRAPRGGGPRRSSWSRSRCRSLLLIRHKVYQDELGEHGSEANASHSTSGGSPEP